MNAMLIFCAVLWVIEAFVQGFNLWTLTSLCATGLFCARKIGHFCKLGSLVGFEFVGGVLTVVFQLLFHRFELVEFIIVVLLRVVFIGVWVYDKNMYVYDTRRVRKDVNVKR